MIVDGCNVQDEASATGRMLADAAIGFSLKARTRLKKNMCKIWRCKGPSLSVSKVKVEDVGSVYVGLLIPSDRVMRLYSASLDECCEKASLKCLNAKINANTC